MGATAIETVAVLMTDLVGSTAMADRLGPAAAEELRQEHFGLLRGALQRTGGREVKNLGDGLIVAFSSALSRWRALALPKRACASCWQWDFFVISTEVRGAPELRRQSDNAPYGQIMSAKGVRTRRHGCRAWSSAWP
jgi:class 3 adenylate cyclase